MFSPQVWGGVHAGGSLQVRSAHVSASLSVCYFFPNWNNHRPLPSRSAKVTGGERSGYSQKKTIRSHCVPGGRVYTVISPVLSPRFSGPPYCPQVYCNVDMLTIVKEIMEMVMESILLRTCVMGSKTVRFQLVKGH